MRNGHGTGVVGGMESPGQKANQPQAKHAEENEEHVPGVVGGTEHQG